MTEASKTGRNDYLPCGFEPAHKRDNISAQEGTYCLVGLAKGRNYTGEAVLRLARYSACAVHGGFTCLCLWIGPALLEELGLI